MSLYVGGARDAELAESARVAKCYGNARKRREASNQACVEGTTTGLLESLEQISWFASCCAAIHEQTVRLFPVGDPESISSKSVG